jgi:hypothetical protein
VIAAMQVVVDVLVDDDWPFQMQSDGRTVQMHVEGAAATWICFVRVHDDDTIVVYSQLPARVPVAGRAAVAELITRINYGLPVGNFEMDFDDGEVRFRTSLDGEDIELRPTLVRHLLGANVSVTEQCLVAVEAVADGRSTPAAALDLVTG